MFRVPVLTVEERIGSYNREMGRTLLKSFFKTFEFLSENAVILTSQAEGLSSNQQYGALSSPPSGQLLPSTCVTQ